MCEPTLTFLSELSLSSNCREVFIMTILAA